jgi:phosphatidylglycerol:prolipoprotein diacylglycerol transferase
MYPTVFEFHGYALSSFGVMLAVAFLVGGWMAARSFERDGLSADVAWRLVTWAMVGGVLGAKLWYVGEAVARDPVARETLFVVGGPLLSRGGITWYGGLAGGALFVLTVAWRRKLPLVRVMNAAAPSLAIGQALGRVGCFLVGDDYGRVTDAWVGIAFPNGLPPTAEPVHPTMLYEVAWLSLGGAILWTRRGRSPFLFGEYLILAGAGRLWIEFFRTNPSLVGPFTNAQLMALACLAIGAAGWLRGALARRGPATSESPS